MRATGTFLTRGWPYFRTLRRQLLLLINLIVANHLFLLHILFAMENLLLSETAGPLHIKCSLLYLIDVAGISICCFEVLLSQY